MSSTAMSSSASASARRETARGPASVGAWTVRVCVPAHGYSDVKVATPDASSTWGDLNTPPPQRPRRAGILLTEIALADEVGAAC